MAKNLRIEFNKDMEQQFRDLPEIGADIKRRTEAIRDACNAQSSWGDRHGGGYYSASSTSPTWGRVWSVDKQRSESRRNRMIRNLDAGA